MKKLLVFILLFSFAIINAKGNQKYINVTGTSELTVPADQINITVQIKSIALSIEESKKNNDKSLNELLAVIKSLNINSDDIQISPISLGKNYEYKTGERVQNGYFTNVDISILLKDLSKYYELTDKLSLSDNYEITSSGYTISNYEVQVKNVFEKALKAAKEKAEYMAKTMNVKLGYVLEIDENNFGGGPVMLNTFAKEDFQQIGVAGKVTITRSVRVKFAIM